MHTGPGLQHFALSRTPVCQLVLQQIGISGNPPLTLFAPHAYGPRSPTLCNFQNARSSANRDHRQSAFNLICASCIRAQVSDTLHFTERPFAEPPSPCPEGQTGLDADQARGACRGVSAGGARLCVRQAGLVEGGLAGKVRV